MTKAEKNELNHALCIYSMARDNERDSLAGYAARSISALIRATRTTKSRNEMITAAAAYPRVVQHPDFIV